jgi:hypothetical protein
MRTPTCGRTPRCSWWKHEDRWTPPRGSGWHPPTCPPDYPYPGRHRALQAGDGQAKFHLNPLKGQRQSERGLESGASLLGHRRGQDLLLRLRDIDPAQWRQRRARDPGHQVSLRGATPYLRTPRTTLSAVPGQPQHQSKHGVQARSRAAPMDQLVTRFVGSSSSPSSLLNRR